MENKKYPKVTVVTPNFNQVNFIESTILSVINQNYPNLEYIIIDGGSTDGSIEIIEKYEKYLSFWVSENDNGIYEAINKGFRRSSGEIMCWINSDDILWENSLYILATAFNKNPEINWLQGLPTVIDENGRVIFRRKAVFSKFYFYSFKHEQSFSFIQQESTFWRRELWQKSGGYLDERYDLAADFDLWMRFFEHDQLFCIDLTLGAFRKRAGQMSADKEKYLGETKLSIKRKLNKLTFTDNFKLKSLLFLISLNKRITNFYLNQVIQKLQSKIIGSPKFLQVENLPVYKRL